MSSFNINNWSFRYRLYLITAVASLSIIISVLLSIFIINKYEYTVEDISQGELLKLYQFSSSFKELSSAHTELFSLLKNKKEKYTEQQIYLLGGKIIDRLDALIANIAAQIKAHEKSQKDIRYMADLKAIDRELSHYRNSSSIAVEMISVNLILSEKYMLKSANSFNQLNSHLSETMSHVTDHIDRKMKHELYIIKKTYWPLITVVILLAVFMIVVNLLIIRMLSSNFRWINQSLDNLRDGNTDIDIPKQSENNEMSKIYSSLDKFRASLLELQLSKNKLLDNNRLLQEESERRLLASKELQHSLIALSKAIDAAEASNKAKSLFLANMSHEIRTPLNAVLGMAQVLQASDLDDLQQEYIDTLYSQGKNLLQILNDILDFSKMESGKFKLDYHSFNLDDLIDEICTLYKNSNQNKNIALKYDIATDVEKNLLGDPLRIRQILVNLLSNAFKFTQQGEIVLKVENYFKDMSCKDIPTINCPNKDKIDHCDWQSLYFSVSDSGIGIDQKMQHYIFNNFTQADESFTRQYGGTGLGLAICKQLVQLMHGEIGVTSEPGQGATFWFYICLPDQTSIGHQPGFEITD